MVRSPLNSTGHGSILPPRLRQTRMIHNPVDSQREAAIERYRVRDWGKGYFSVNRHGCVSVRPYKVANQAVDLKALVDQLKERGLELPLLIRFTDVLRHRVADLTSAFAVAMRESCYQGDYYSIYPIKVNQQRQVVEDLVECAKQFPLGLECGSKPELLAALALTSLDDNLVICNGFKDDDFLEMVMFAQKIGKTVIPVVEQFGELELILHYAREVGIRPVFGVRAKLSSPGAGRWEQSSGPQSKFGLTATELVRVVARLQEEGLCDCLTLLHFHMGSQITNILNIKAAITEAARIYVELKRAGIGLGQLDVGGGLGVDYDGSRGKFESSINYSLEEYANDVVSHIKTVCDEAGVEHPTIITEAGRALAAYHSVLVVNVLGTSTDDSESENQGADPDGSVPANVAQPIKDLRALLRGLTTDNILESYHGAVHHYNDSVSAFNLGYLSLEERSMAERLYLKLSRRILELARRLDPVPDVLKSLEDDLCSTYFCNFSVFQSLPDSWAIEQLFPIMPIHRLLETPTRRGVLADITCDSDGKVDRFVGGDEVGQTLALHEPNGDDYYLGIFLVGAYQEILGDLHNLFGDTNSVHVRLDESPRFGADGEADPTDVNIDMVLNGDTMAQVLTYVQYSPRELVSRIRQAVESALRARKISLSEAARFVRFLEQSLNSSTYIASRETPGGPKTPAISDTSVELTSEAAAADQLHLET